MLSVKLIIFIFFAFASVDGNMIQIPEEFKNAEDINEHPRIKEILSKNFPLVRGNPDEINEVTPLIVGGNATTLGQIPHHVLIYILQKDKNSKLLLI